MAELECLLAILGALPRLEYLELEPELPLQEGKLTTLLWQPCFAFELSTNRRQQPHCSISLQSHACYKGGDPERLPPMLESAIGGCHDCPDCRSSSWSRTGIAAEIDDTALDRLILICSTPVASSLKSIACGYAYPLSSSAYSTPGGV